MADGPKTDREEHDMSMPSCSRTVFGPAKPTKLDLMGVRFFAPPPEPGNGGGGSEFTPPESQEALQKLIDKAVARTHKQYEGFDDFKDKASKWDAHEQAEAGKKPKPPGDGGEDPKPLTDDEVQKRIDDALKADREAATKELAIERVTDALDKALEDRTGYTPSQIRALDLEQFIGADGKHADKAAIQAWVDENTTEGPKQVRRDPGAGHKPDGQKSGVEAGADAYAQRHPSKTKQ